MSATPPGPRPPRPPGQGPGPGPWAPPQGPPLHGQPFQIRPQGTPVPRRPRRKGPGWLPGLVIAVCAVLGSALILVAGRPPADLPASAMATLLPPDGQAAIMVHRPDQTVMTVETARLYGAQFLSAGPESFTPDGMTQEQVLTASWVRLVHTEVDEADGLVARTQELRMVTPGGLATLVRTTEDGSQRFSPGLLELPTDIAPGRSWKSQGKVLMSDGQTAVTRDYSATSTATVAPEPTLTQAGCVQVATRLAVTTEETQETRQTWCPGKGLTAQVRDGRAYQAQDGFPATGDPRASLTTTDDPVQTSLPSWTVRDLDSSSRPLSMVSIARPVGLPNGAWVLSNRPSGDLIAFTAAGNGIRRHWRAHPGGEITAHAAFGDVSVAVTTARRIVGYGPHGERLWATQLSDITLNPPVRLDDQTFVVGLQDGSVRGYRIRTGEELWRARTSADIDLPLGVAAGRVVAVDQTGQITAFDTAGRQLWTGDFNETIGAFALADGFAVASSRDGVTVFAVSLADGASVWKRSILRTRTDLVAFGTQIVVRTGAIGAFSLSARTGEQVWEWNGESLDLIVAGNWVIAGGFTTVTAIDARGTVAASWNLSERKTTAASYWLTARSDGFFLSDSNLQFTVGSPR